MNKWQAALMVVGVMAVKVLLIAVGCVLIGFGIGLTNPACLQVAIGVVCLYIGVTLSVNLKFN